ncbi:MAG: general secretion pathway protein GspB [Gammaproteobacteria bacterium]
MSYILNALRKSEQERKSAQAEHLENGILDKPEPLTRRSPAPVWILVSLNVVLLGYFAWLHFGDRPAGAPEHKTTAEIKPQKAPDAAPPSRQSGPKTVTVQTPPAEPIIPKARPETESPVPSISELVEKRRTAPSEKRVKTPPAAVETTAEPAADETAQAEPDVLEPAETPTDEPTGPETPVAVRTAPPPAAVKPAQPAVALLRELPYDFRRGVPKLNINVFVYDDDPAQRFVIVDMAKYTSGQTLANGMTLMDIQQNGLVLRFKGRTFLFPRP